MSKKLVINLSICTGGSGLHGMLRISSNKGAKGQLKGCGDDRL